MVDIKNAQPHSDVTSVTQQQQNKLRETQFRQKTLELAGVNRKIAQCWQHLATKADETSQRNLSRALKTLVLKRTLLQEQITALFSE